MEQNNALAAQLRSSRNKARLSQQAAAAALSCLDKRTLQRYEKGDGAPSREIIDAMAVVYNDPALPMKCILCEVIDRYSLPDPDYDSAGQAVTAFMNASLSAEDNSRTLLKLGSGGQCTGQEMEAIMPVVMQAITSGLALLPYIEEHRNEWRPSTK